MTPWCMIQIRVLGLTGPVGRMAAARPLGRPVGAHRPAWAEFGRWLVRVFALLPLLAGMNSVASAAAVQVSEHEVTYPAVDVKDQWKAPDKRTGTSWKISTRQVVLENAFVRVVMLPQLGGRIAEIQDKTTGKQMFYTVSELGWSKNRYNAYNACLGGIEINFPYFHHGNDFSDQWNWTTQRLPDGSAAVIMGWTDRDSRQRALVRVSLGSDDARVRFHYRFANRNDFTTGFAPYINTMPAIRDDLRYIFPTQHVVPHGFNSSALQALPWPWPEYDAKSVCYWRNITMASVFAIQLEENFHGLYYEQDDYGLVRLFDRRAMPGVKLWNIPPPLGEIKLLEVWASPCQVMEDLLWCESMGVRDYEETYYPVHGIGGYRFANDNGAVNLTRTAEAVELGVSVTRPLRNAIVMLSSTDGVWWRSVQDLSPDKPLRYTVKRAPGPMPLEVHVLDADGQEVLSYQHCPNPGARTTVSFTGKPMWQGSSQLEALMREQWSPLYRGGTGGWSGLGDQGMASWRALLKQDPTQLAPRLGFARSALMDGLLRRPERTRGATPEAIAKQVVQQYDEALGILTPVLNDPRAATLAAEIYLRRGQPAQAVDCLRAVAADDPEANFQLARACAAQGKITEARRAAAVALQAFPRAAPVVQLAAGLAILENASRDAVPLLNRLLAEDPLDPISWRLLALAAGKARDAAQAKSATAQLTALLAQTGPGEGVDVDAEFAWLGLSALLTK